MQVPEMLGWSALWSLCATEESSFLCISRRLVLLLDCRKYNIIQRSHDYIVWRQVCQCASKPLYIRLYSLQLYSQLCFHKAEWNLQFFRFRSRRLQTTVFAFDALIYQNYESETKVKSAPLDYVFNQLDLILSNWDSVLNASLQFLSFFVSL